MPYTDDADMGEDADLVIAGSVERHFASLGRIAPLHKAFAGGLDVLCRMSVLR